MTAFFLVQLTVILVLRRKLGKVQLGMQQTMQAAQARIQRQIQMFQQRPVGSPKLMQQKLESMQNDALHETPGRPRPSSRTGTGTGCFRARSTR
jgi:hypothetical protein